MTVTVDLYYLKHSDTGSSNTSKVTPEWKGILEKARYMHHEGMLNGTVLEIAYALVRSQTRHGIPWNKCRECGTPYRLDGLFGTMDHCSRDCKAAGIADMPSHD